MSDRDWRFPRKGWRYWFVAQHDALWWLYCKTYEYACLLRGPHRWTPIWPDPSTMHYCERCPVWAFPDGTWAWGWYR